MFGGWLGVNVLFVLFVCLVLLVAAAKMPLKVYISLDIYGPYIADQLHLQGRTNM